MLFFHWIATGCNYGNNDFAAGYVIGSWVNGDWDYDEGFGGFGSD